MRRWTVRHEWLIPLLSVVVVVQLVAGLAAVAVGGRAAQQRGEYPLDLVTAADPAQRAQWASPQGDGLLFGGFAMAPIPAPAPGDLPVPPPVADVPHAEAVATVTAPLLTPTAEPEPAPSPLPPSAEPAPSAPAPPPPAPGPAEPEEEPSQQPMSYQAAGPSESERIFSQEFPAQAAARQTEGDPSSFAWAVIVGVNQYHGRTRNTLGSVADAQLLRQELLSRGWRDDHILLLLDGHGTHDRIIRGIEWLIRSTDARSTAVFSFSGHMRRQSGDPARDGDAVDVGLWAADNRYIWDTNLGRMLGAVPSGRLWASLQGCHAGGLRTPALEQPGRVVTYSSLESQKSYEDPEVGHSVQGFYLFNEGIAQGLGDRNGDGRVSVQEAYDWAAPRAHVRTSERQSPQLFDGLGGRDFYLEIGA